jgi:hypothetical protein
VMVPANSPGVFILSQRWVAIGICIAEAAYTSTPLSPFHGSVGVSSGCDGLCLSGRSTSVGSCGCVIPFTPLFSCFEPMSCDSGGHFCFRSFRLSSKIAWRLHIKCWTLSSLETLQTFPHLFWVLCACSAAHGTKSLIFKKLALRAYGMSDYDFKIDSKINISMKQK